MKKKSNQIIIGGILFLTCFLPYYSLLRGFALIYFPDSVSNIINLIRDFTIITLFVISFISSRENFCIQNKISFAINVILTSFTFAFFVTLFRGYPKIAVQSAHLSILPIFLFFAAKSGQKRNPLFFEIFLNSVLIIGVIVGITSTYFYFLRPQVFLNLFEVLYTVGDETSEDLALSYTRMIGPFFSPNVLGNFMATIGLISFVNVVRKKNEKLNWLIFFMALINVILSFSRGSWLFEIGGLFVIIFFLKGAVTTISKISVVAVIALFLGISSITYSSNIDISLILNDRLSSILDKQSNAYSRFSELDGVIDTIKKNPFGAGLGAGSQSSTGELGYINDVGVDVIDSYYLKVLVEGGILGLFVFLSSMCYIIAVFFRRLNGYYSHSSEGVREFTLVSLAISIGTLLQSIGSNPFDYVATAPFLWVFLGISSELLKYEKY